MNIWLLLKQQASMVTSSRLQNSYIVSSDMLYLNSLVFFESRNMQSWCWKSFFLKTINETTLYSKMLSKRFSDNEKSIFTYDKQQSKAYPASMMSVCCEDDMYSISDSYIENTNKETGSHFNRLTLEHNHFAKYGRTDVLSTFTIHRCHWKWMDFWYGTISFAVYREKRVGITSCNSILSPSPQLKDSTVNDYLRMEKAGIDMVKCILAKEKVMRPLII